MLAASISFHFHPGDTWGTLPFALHGLTGPSSKAFARSIGKENEVVTMQPLSMHKRDQHMDLDRIANWRTYTHTSSTCIEGTYTHTHIKHMHQRCPISCWTWSFGFRLNICQFCRWHQAASAVYPTCSQHTGLAARLHKLWHKPTSSKPTSSKQQHISTFRPGSQILWQCWHKSKASGAGIQRRLFTLMAQKYTSMARIVHFNSSRTSGGVALGQLRCPTRKKSISATTCNQVTGPGVMVKTTW